MFFFFGGKHNVSTNIAVWMWKQRQHIPAYKARCFAVLCKAGAGRSTKRVPQRTYSSRKYWFSFHSEYNYLWETEFWTMSLSAMMSSCCSYFIISYGSLNSAMWNINRILLPSLFYLSTTFPVQVYNFVDGNTAVPGQKLLFFFFSKLVCTLFITDEKEII